MGPAQQIVMTQAVAALRDVAKLVEDKILQFKLDSVRQGVEAQFGRDKPHELGDYYRATEDWNEDVGNDQEYQHLPRIATFDRRHGFQSVDRFADVDYADDKLLQE